ncbi:MAG: hypothetical protein JNL88_05655 [Bacteroidia bacterium]|nr:hypothetical protein [Bacteroidia bacterium]
MGILFHYGSTVPEASFPDMRKFLCLLLLAVISAESPAQVYVEGGHRRHRFAQFNIGTDTRVFPGSDARVYRIHEQGVRESYRLKSHAESRLILGGTHFWGHADFFIAIPLMAYGERAFSSGVETGARCFPWRLEHRKVRPFAGVSLVETRFRQGEGSREESFTAALSAGLVYQYRQHQVELVAGRHFSKRLVYSISRTEQAGFRLPALWFSAGYKYSLDLTLSAEKDWLSGRTRRLTDTLAARGQLNGLSLSAGPGAAFYLRPSSHNDRAYPYLGRHRSARVFPDLGIGYYWHRPDLQLNLAWRSIGSRKSAYGTHQELRRRSLCLELYRFIGDYHGFAPFIGPAFSHEQWRVKTKMGGQEEERYGAKKFRAGITFGWDIRPNRLQALYLRTNLRWFPQLRLPTEQGRHFSFDQLEFNFIQLVIFPGRFLARAG